MLNHNERESRISRNRGHEIDERVETARGSSDSNHAYRQLLRFLYGVFMRSSHRHRIASFRGPFEDGGSGGTRTAGCPDGSGLVRACRDRQIRRLLKVTAAAYALFPFWQRIYRLLPLWQAMCRTHG